MTFQTSNKPEDQRRATNRCRRCGKFSNGELCETHLRLETARQDANNNTESNEPGTSYTLPMKPAKKKRLYNRVVMHDSSSCDSEATSNHADKNSSGEENTPEDAALRAEIGREIERMRSQTPMPTSPIGCSTGIATDAAQPDTSGTPIRGQSAANTGEITQDNAGKIRLKQKNSAENSKSNFNSEPRRSERIKTAQRVVKLCGVEYF